MPREGDSEGLLFVLHLTAVLLGLAAAFWLPGRLLVDLLLPHASPEERLPVAMGLGLALVGTVSVLAVGLLGLAGPWHLTAPVLWTVVASLTVALAAARVAVRGRDFSAWVARPTRTEVAVWCLTALAFAFYLLRYDGDLLWEDACMVRAASAIHGETLTPDRLAILTGGEPLSVYQSDPLLGQRPGRNAFILHNQGERIGPGLLIAPMMALAGPAAFRLVYALQGILLPGLGFVLGRRLLGRARWGLAVALLLAFSPWGIQTRTFDENLMASCFGTLALVLLLRDDHAPLAAALASAMFLSLRQEAFLPALPFVLAWVARTSRGGPRTAGLYLAGLAVASAPYLLVHIGSMVVDGAPWFEGAFERPLAPHSFLGMDFDARVLLGFPFVPEPVRSPYNAYPTMVAFPLDLARNLGIVFASLVPAGLALLLRMRRADAWMLVAWAAPLLLLVMVQSNWIEPNKMGIPASVGAPIVIAVAAGMAFVLSRDVPPVRRAAWLAGGLAAPLAFAWTVRDYQAPVDGRVFGMPMELYQKVLPPTLARYSEETPEYVAHDRGRLAPGLLPATGLLDWPPALIARDAARLAEDLASQRMASYERPMPDLLQLAVVGTGLTVGPLSILQAIDSGRQPPSVAPLRPFEGPRDAPSVDLTIDLGSPPLLAEQPIRPGVPDGAEVLDPDSGPFLVSGYRITWSEHPENVAVARDRFGTIHVVFMAGTPAHIASSHPVQPTRLHASSFPPGRVHLRAREGDVIRLIEVRCFRPARWYSRFAVVRDGRVWLSAPEAVSPA